MGGNGEGEADVHAGRVALDRGIEELLDTGEIDDLVELALDLGSGHAEDRAVQVDVLPAGQLGMESSADLEQAGDAAMDLDAAGRRFGDPAQDLEQGRLAGAVAADDADAVTLFDLEIDVLERPELLDLGDLAVRRKRMTDPLADPSEFVHQDVAQGRIALLFLVADQVLLGQAFDLDGGHGEIRAKGKGKREKGCALRACADYRLE